MKTIKTYLIQPKEETALIKTGFSKITGNNRISIHFDNSKSKK